MYQEEAAVHFNIILTYCGCHTFHCSDHDKTEIPRYVAYKLFSNRKECLESNLFLCLFIINNHLQTSMSKLFGEMLDMINKLYFCFNIYRLQYVWRPLTINISIDNPDLTQNFYINCFTISIDEHIFISDGFYFISRREKPHLSSPGPIKIEKIRRSVKIV